MFYPVTAAFLRNAPALPGLDPEALPQILTERFAELVARRLRQAEGEAIAGQDDEAWPLTRIADTYELITSIIEDQDTKRAAAFVAGTAQQILAQETIAQQEPVPILDRDRVNPAVAAAVLFLAAEQYADAIEAAQKIHIAEGQQDFVATLLAEDIRDLAAGRLSSILDRARRRPEHFVARGGLEARSVTALFETLLVGIEIFAAEVLGEPVPAKAAERFDTARSAFLQVIHLSSRHLETGAPMAGTLLTTYPGPRHLAALFFAAYDGTLEAAITKIDPPPGVDKNFWKAWLRHRAETAPFTWQNHREAVTKQFHHNGNSAVMVLPTGAGKTTVSCLKIASVLGSAKSVVHVNLRQRGQRARKLVVIFSFAGSEPNVLQQQHLTIAQILSELPWAVSYAIVRKKDLVDAQQLNQALAHRGQRQLPPGPPLGTPEVRAQHHLSTLFTSVLDRGKRAHDPRVISHTAVVRQRTIQVYSNEGSQTCQVELFD